jgi:hypothetical protein
MSTTITRPLSTAFLLAALAILLGCASSSQRLSIPPDQGALAGIKSIHLGNFGGGEGSDLVREKLRVRLISSGRFEVVEIPDRADAILTGSAGVEKRLDEGTTDYRGTGLLRLVDTKTQKTVWAHEYQRGFMFGGSVSTRVANQMADQLLKDAGDGR